MMVCPGLCSPPYCCDLLLTMSLVNATKTIIDDGFLRVVFEEGKKSTDCNRSLGSGDYSRICDNSHQSTNYSRSLSSHDYSEDFLSEYSEVSDNGNDLKQYESKAKEKIKKTVHKVFQPKGAKGTSSEKVQNWKMPLLNPQVNMISKRRDALTHRIMSARLHKIKELKNEIADVQRRLEATVMENQLLKRLQFRHLKAIGKYENSQNNLPQIMAKHQNEVKNLKFLLRKSQEKEQNLSRKLREVDLELLKTKDSLQSLQKLSENTNLAEREELTQRLSILTVKMETNEKRIQGLEKQLKLNSSAFSRQLAAENRKTVAARTATRNLQMEIKCLQQKLKEKDRELDIKNIYTNRILQNFHERDGQLKDSTVTKSGQADKEGFPLVHLTNQKKKETKDSAPLSTKGKKTTESCSQKEKAVEIRYEEKQNLEKHPINKSPKQEELKRIQEPAVSCSPGSGSFLKLEPAPSYGPVRTSIPEGEQSSSSWSCTWNVGLIEGIPKVQDVPELPKGDRHPRAMHTPPEKVAEQIETKEEQEEKVGFSGEDLEKLAKREQVPHVITPEKDSQEQDVAGKKETSSIHLKDAGEVPSKHSLKRSRIPIKQRKYYSFTEAIENLHQGLPASGVTSTTTSTRNSRGPKKSDELAELKLESSEGGYVPSFGKTSKPKQQQNPEEKCGNCIAATFKDRKSSLMEELFGSGCVFKSTLSNPVIQGSNKEKKTLGNEGMHNPHSSQATATLNFGDSKLNSVKSLKSPSPSEGKGKLMI
ncbi:lebercilin-like protein isoform X1 [Ornithorhynchus anatinus]|uniref:lebercilin-like protein isoform X1 n=2 Tax=Ornithorhynchus anatinus TaxID=9258 RepID=UPI0010A79EBA|nr:lebercilin-like protein isoform X1 [Ornithorhynchus anatinus]